jgi:hypothetical protein
MPVNDAEELKRPIHRAYPPAVLHRRSNSNPIGSATPRPWAVIGPREAGKTDESRA